MGKINYKLRNINLHGIRWHPYADAILHDTYITIQLSRTLQVHNERFLSCLIAFTQILMTNFQKAVEQ